MEKFISTVEAISEYSGRWLSWVVYVGIIFLSLEVVLRYVFNSPTVWAHGYSQRFFGSYFIIIGAYTFVRKGHVRVDIIYEHMSKRVKALLDLLNCFFLLIWSIVMIPVGWKFFMKSYAINEVDEMVLAHPIWWVKFLIVVGMILISLQGVSEVVKIILGMLGRTPKLEGGEGGKA